MTRNTVEGLEDEALTKQGISRSNFRHGSKLGCADADADAALISAKPFWVRSIISDLDSILLNQKSVTISPTTHTNSLDGFASHIVGQPKSIDGIILKKQSQIRPREAAGVIFPSHIC